MQLDDFSGVSCVVASQSLELGTKGLADDDIQQISQVWERLIMNFWNDEIVALALQWNESQAADRCRGANADPGVGQTGLHSRGDFEMG